MLVSGWRDEGAELPSILERVSRWLQHSQPAPGASSEDVSHRMAQSLHELLDASATVIWIDENGDGALRFAACAGDCEPPEDLQSSVQANEDSWPLAPFFLVEGTGATRDLASNLGLLSEKVAAPSLCVPLGGVAVALFWLQSSDGRLDEQWSAVLPGIGEVAGATMWNAIRLEKLGNSFHQLAVAVSHAIDGREAHREGHSQDVAFYATLIARAMGLDEASVERIEYAALWHGLGRLSVPDAILQKDAPLSPEELDTVRCASVWGAQKLQNVEGLEEVALAIRHQNEHFDGTGSPDGLQGSAIPVGARIIAVATRFAGMTKRRSDRAPLSVVGGAMDSLAQNSGGALDPDVVAAFVRAMGRSI